MIERILVCIALLACAVALVYVLEKTHRAARTGAWPALRRALLYLAIVALLTIAAVAQAALTFNFAPLQQEASLGLVQQAAFGLVMLLAGGAVLAVQTARLTKLWSQELRLPWGPQTHRSLAFLTGAVLETGLGIIITADAALSFADGGRAQIWRGDWNRILDSEYTLPALVFLAGLFLLLWFSHLLRKSSRDEALWWWRGKWFYFRRAQSPWDYWRAIGVSFFYAGLGAVAMVLAIMAIALTAAE